MKRNVLKPKSKSPLLWSLFPFRRVYVYLDRGFSFAGDSQDLPRVQLIQKLLDVLLLMPSVSKLARATFLQVTDAISANETKEELWVLLHGLLLPSANVRSIVLQALEPFDLEETEIPEILSLALHDSEERNSELATTLYETNSIHLDPSGLSRLFALLGTLQSMFLTQEHETAYVRETAAKALAAALTDHSNLFDDYLSKLFDLYTQNARIT